MAFTDVLTLVSLMIVNNKYVYHLLFSNVHLLIHSHLPVPCRHDIDTVKKKPSEKPAPIPEGPVRQSLVFKEMFSGQQDGDVTLPEVNIDDELKELDDDFGDFDDTGVEDLEPDPKGC